MSTFEQRSAREDELCTCSRQAVLVYVFTDPDGTVREVGYCGLPDGGNRSGPCPFCGASEQHQQPWGDPMPCPEYRLRPASEGYGQKPTPCR